MTKNKQIYVTEESESAQIIELITHIKEDSWVDRDTIIVNCFPDYSSILCQKINHKLSHVNDDELLEQIPLEIRYPIMSQVWDRFKAEYVNYEAYLAEWMATNVNSNLKYLFVTSILQGKDYDRVLRSMKNRLEHTQFRLACLYWDETSTTTPDYFVKKVNQEEDGRVLFQWENSKNPNW